MPSGAATYLTREAPGEVHGSGKQYRVYVSTALGNYETGGVTLTLPTADITGKDLVAVNVLTPLGQPVTSDLYFAWDGSVTAPKIHARAFSTGVETTNGSATGTVKLELVYGDNG